MSRFSNIRISKGGRVLADEWNWDKETKSGEMNRGFDITDHFIYHMEDTCVLEDGVTFKDILLLMESIDMYPVLSPMFTRGPWLKDMVDEGLAHEESETSMDAINLNWVASVNDDFYNEGKDILESYINASGHINGEDETYALDFTPLHELVDCKIILDNELVVVDERKKSLEGRREYLDSLSLEEREQETYSPILLQTRKDFTLYDILHGLFWELSFHGSPTSRDEKRNELFRND